MPTPPSCTALDTLPVPDAATLQFLTTGRSSASDQQPNCSNQQTYYQSQFHAPLSPGATRKLSPRGQGLSGVYPYFDHLVVESWIVKIGAVLKFVLC